MVIECIGLSGSGKTELLELIEKELKRREVDYVNVSANLRRGIVWKFLRVIAGALIFLSADARWLRDRLRGILEKEEPAGGHGTNDSGKGVIRSLAVYSFWYRRMIRSHRIFLFDEGMVHTLMMFCADHKVSEEAFRKMVMASERGIRSARLVISVEASSAEQDDHADELRDSAWLTGEISGFWRSAEKMRTAKSSPGSLAGFGRSSPTRGKGLQDKELSIERL